MHVKHPQLLILSSKSKNWWVSIFDRSFLKIIPNDRILVILCVEILEILYQSWAICFYFGSLSFFIVICFGWRSHRTHWISLCSGLEYHVINSFWIIDRTERGDPLEWELELWYHFKGTRWNFNLEPNSLTFAKHITCSEASLRFQKSHQQWRMSYYISRFWP